MVKVNSRGLGWHVLFSFFNVLTWQRTWEHASVCSQCLGNFTGSENTKCRKHCLLFLKIKLYIKHYFMLALGAQHLVTIIYFTKFPLDISRGTTCSYYIIDYILMLYFTSPGPLCNYPLVLFFFYFYYWYYYRCPHCPLSLPIGTSNPFTVSPQPSQGSSRLAASSVFSVSLSLFLCCLVGYFGLWILHGSNIVQYLLFCGSFPSV